MNVVKCFQYTASVVKSYSKILKTSCLFIERQNSVGRVKEIIKNDYLKIKECQEVELFFPKVYKIFFSA